GGGVGPGQGRQQQRQAEKEGTHGVTRREAGRTRLPYSRDRPGGSLVAPRSFSRTNRYPHRSRQGRMTIITRQPGGVHGSGYARVPGDETQVPGYRLSGKECAVTV